MKKYLKFVKSVGIFFQVAILLSLVACSSKKMPEDKKIQIEQSYLIPDPGAVEFVYEPPMIDVVNVPPGLDPEGIYYRPSHQEIVEIRQGRWQYYKPKSAR